MGAETALIFGSAPYSDWSFLAPLRGSAVFCADGGVACARAAGFRPDFYIGDGDSGGAPIEGAEAVVLPAVKDVTDLQAAYEAARDRGHRRMVLTACTGGRQDHHLAALQLLETARKDGVDAALWDPWNEITCRRGSVTIPDDGRFRYFSLIPIDPELRGVTIQNAKYPLQNASARRGDSLTISNEPIGGPVSVRVCEGSFYLIRSERLHRT